MSGYATPKFPPEMFDAVIDQVYALNVKRNDPEKILGAFSLVSKSWLPRSRRYLFQKVSIDRDSLRTKAKPLDILDSPLCTFKPYVQILELDEGLKREPTWLGDALRRLSVLPAVRDLTINGGTFTSTNSPKILSKFHNLQRLVLDTCDFASIAQFLDTLSICKSLKRLGLYHLWVVGVHSDSAIGVNSPPPSSLRCVAIHSPVGLNSMMEWLVCGEQVPVIETLELSYISIHTSRAIGHSLQRLGPSLKNLELQFAPNISSQNAFFRDLDLTYNTNLISLCFRFGPISSLLAQVTSSKVREVVVDVAARDIEDLRGTESRWLDWDAIARILDQPNFSELERLILPCATIPDVDEVRRWMMLPPGRARDKLIFCEKWDENRP